MRRRGLHTLGAVVAGLTRPVFGKRGLAHGAIVTDWPAIVGPVIAAHTLPERVTRPGADGPGVLILRVAASALATEVQHLVPQIVERINTYFGFAAVARIRLVHGPLPRRPGRTDSPNVAPSPEDEKRLADWLTEIRDPELRGALTALGRALVRGRASGQ